MKQPPHPQIRFAKNEVGVKDAANTRTNAFYLDETAQPSKVGHVPSETRNQNQPYRIQLHEKIEIHGTSQDPLRQKMEEKRKRTAIFFSIETMPVDITMPRKIHTPTERISRNVYLPRNRLSLEMIVQARLPPPALAAP